jgi:archaellum component FlaD/FlaE
VTQSNPADPRRTAAPHLESLSGDASKSVAVMEWARYLAAAFGTEGAVAALRYYRDVNWISERVRRTMVDYVRGLSLDDLGDGGDDFAIDLDDSVESLEGTPFEKHARSVEYVSAIAGDSIERDLLPMRLSESEFASGDGLPENPFDAADD